MAVRQYIGARYVPKFYENSDSTSDWRSGVAYEPLTIVTYNGNSYTSKKAVPASVGNPSSNTTYWVATGTYNEQVEAYRQQVEEYKAEVDSLEDVVNVSPSEECYIFISDSYGGAFGNPSGDTTTIWDLLENKLGMSGRLYFCTYTASGFVDNVNPPFLTRFQNEASTISAALDVDKVTKIIVVAGRNDYISNEAAVFDAMAAFDSYAKTTYKNAKTYYGFIAGGDNSSAGTKAQLILNSYRPYRRCNEFGGIYLNGVEAAIHMSGALATDGIHPTIVGKRYIADAIFEAVTQGEYSASFPPAQLAMSPDSGYTYTVAPDINMLVENNALYFFTEQMEMDISIPSTNFGANTNCIFNLGTLDRGQYIQNPFGTICIPVTLLINDNYIPGQIRISAVSRVNVLFRTKDALSNVTRVRISPVFTMAFWPIVYC